MKKLFFLALMAFALPMSTWANEAGEEWGTDSLYDETEQRIETASVSLKYKVLTAATPNDADSPGTVELEGLADSSESATVGALSIAHLIVHAEYNATTQNVDIDYYEVVGISAGAFASNTTILSVTIPYSVTYIGSDSVNDSSSLDGAFQNCTGLTSVAITDTEGTPSKLESIGNRGFYNCSALTSINFPASLTYLGRQAFRTCNALTSIDIPEGVTTIDYYTFGYCYALASVTLPSTLTSIGESAFRNCNSLTEVIIPEVVKSYGVDAFASCSSLKTVVLLDDDPSDVTFAGSASSNNDVFNNDSGITFYVPQGSEAAYLASVWEDEVLTDNDYWNFFSIDIAETYTDGTNYYATYYMDEADYELSDVTLYAITSAENGEATMEALSGDIIPSGTPLLIESSVAGIDYFWKDYYGADGDQAGYLSGTTPTTISVPENNMLYGHSEAAYTCAANGEYDASKVDGYLYYKLSLKSSSDPTSVGFYYGAANGASYQASAHKCWLAVPTESSSADGISLKKGDSDDTTGISAVESASEKTVSGIYTIQGVRVSNMNQPGLYIVDGKKVLVK